MDIDHPYSAQKRYLIMEKAVGEVNGNYSIGAFLTYFVFEVLAGIAQPLLRSGSKFPHLLIT